MRKWISLVSIASLNDEAADGLLKLPLLRAIVLRIDWKEIGMHREVDELFLLGLLSVRDALLNMRMSDVLAEIPVGASHAIGMNENLLPDLYLRSVEW
jgi:c-di-GMP-related signal transduction protein